MFSSNGTELSSDERESVLSSRPACLPTPTVAMRGYDLLPQVRLALKTTRNISERETKIAGEASSNVADAYERMRIHLSSSVVPTITILREILAAVEANDLLQLLDTADSGFETRMKQCTDQISPPQTPPTISER